MSCAKTTEPIEMPSEPEMWTREDAIRNRQYPFNAQGDSGVISMPAVFRRHLVGKALINVFHCDSAEIRMLAR